MANANELLKKLIIDESDTLQELEKLVEAASKFFRIERPSGRVVFRDFKKLTDKQRIAALLSAKYFAAKSQIITDQTLRIREIIKEGFVEPLPEKKYSIVHHRLTELFERVLAVPK